MARQEFMTGLQTGETIWQDQSDPDTSDHRQILALFNGSVEFANGERGRYAGVEVITIGDENEPFTGSHIFMLADGSTSHQTFRGVVTRRDRQDSLIGVGTWQVVGGTGRLADLAGGGTFDWSIDGERYQAQFRPAPVVQ